MKRFFCIFFVFFVLFFVFCNTNQAKSEEKYAHSSVDRIFDHFDSLYRNLDEKANASEVVDTSFGSLQVLSADSGTDGVKALLFALNIRIKQGHLQTPHLRLEQQENINSFQILYPTTFFDVGKNSQITVPFYVNVKQPGEDVSFQLIAELNWCQNTENCTDEKYVIPMTVGAGQNNFSNYTAFVINSMRYVPFPAEADQIQIHSINEDTFWLLLNMPKKIHNVPRLVLLDADNHQVDYKQEFVKIINHRALFVIKTHNMDQISQVIINANHKWITQKMDKSYAPLPDLSNYTEPKKTHLFYAWIVFLLCSPMISLLLKLQIRNEICARKILQNKMLGILGGVLTVAAMYTYLISYNYLINSFLWLSFCCGLFMLCACFAIGFTSFSYGTLIGLMPYFSILRWLGFEADYSSYDQFIFFICVALLNMLPLFILWIKPKWAVHFSKGMPTQATVITCLPMALNSLLFVIILLLKIR